MSFIGEKDSQNRTSEHRTKGKNTGAHLNFLYSKNDSSSNFKFRDSYGLAKFTDGICN